jgi:hypothetical protein
MAVTPDRLDGVTANVRDSHELKCRRRQRAVRIFVKIAHDIHLPFATGAGTMATQLFQPHKTFAAVLPLDREFFANWLNIRRSHIKKLTRCDSARPRIRFTIVTLRYCRFLMIIGTIGAICASCHWKWYFVGSCSGPIGRQREQLFSQPEVLNPLRAHFDRSPYNISKTR